MVYQELSLAPHLTVTENVFLGVEPSSLGRFDRRQARDEVVRLARGNGLDLDPDALVGVLSAAVRQQVEILRAMARGARVLILDEPTSSLSERDVEPLIQTLRRLRDQGLAVIYISHRLEEIESLADTLTVLRDGRLVYSGPADLSRAQVIRHMVGRDMNSLFPPRRGHDLGSVMLEARSLEGPGFQDVNLSVRAGEIVGLAGLVGAGRSEFAAAVSGACRYTGGSLFLDGVPVRFRHPGQAIGRGLGLLTEDRRRTGVFPHLSVVANMSMPALRQYAQFGRIQFDREARDAQSVRDRLSLKAGGMDALITSLSGGNQQKTLFGRWLLASSRVLVLDEPTRGIDVGSKYDIYELILDLAAGGLAILVISSELPELFGISDRIVVMCRGVVTADLATAETSPDEVMHYAMVPEPVPLGASDG
jgi:ABC-type sugar transport system ATPase subunit